MEAHMSFCAECGNKLPENSLWCPNCGTKVSANATPQSSAAAAGDQQSAPQDPTIPAPTTTPVYSQGSYADQAQAVEGIGLYHISKSDQNLRLAAFVLNVICTISLCWAIIPLAWMVPMTVHSWGIYKGNKPNTVGFGVCTLIFLSLIGGILLLCSSKEE